MLVGNKSDLEDERQVDTEMGRQVGVSMFVFYNNYNLKPHGFAYLPPRAHGVEQHAVLCCSSVVMGVTNVISTATCTSSHVLLYPISMCPHVFYTTSTLYLLTCGFLFACNN